MTTEIINGFYVNIDYGQLTMQEREDNGFRIAQNLYNLGWTEQAIAGALGNIQGESTINPGCIENNSTHPRPAAWTTLPDNATILGSNYVGGIGITQWTPGRDKIVQWAEDNGRLWYDGMAQIFRIKYESENGIQMTATQWNFYIHNENDTPEDMAEYFLRYYENPSPEQYEASVNNRRMYGLAWYIRIHNNLHRGAKLFWMSQQNRRRKEEKPRCLRM